MKKPFLFLFILLSSIPIFAQTQKFDVMTYTPPKGWTAGQNGSAKTFTTIDKAAGKFCLMMLHPSITNHGSPSQDFAYVWKTLVQETFNAGGNPEKETTEADGFTIIQGGELIDYEGSKALALLTTVSGKGRVISLLSIMNDAKYSPDVQNFLGGMDVDIKETPKQNTSATTNNSGNSSSLSDWVYQVPDGMTETTKSPIITLDSNNDCKLLLLPFQNSSGNLESDLITSEAIFLKGWTDSGDEIIQRKGTLGQGIQYFSQGRKMKNPANGTFSYTLLYVFSRGNQFATLLGYSRMGSSDSALGIALDGLKGNGCFWEAKTTPEYLAPFLHSLSFKNYQPTNNNPLAKEIIGNWWTVSTSVANNYVFAANGNYSNATAGVKSERQYTANLILQEFSSWAGDGKYSLKGNSLTMSRRGGKTDVGNVRVFYENNFYAGRNKNEWKKRLGIFMVRNGSAGELILDEEK
jgi:hypothetical protein